MGNPSQSYGTSSAIWDHIHTVLPATRYKWMRPASASKLVLDLPAPEGWKAELT